MAAELGMSGDGTDEEVVKLSIEGKVEARSPDPISVPTPSSILLLLLLLFSLLALMLMLLLLLPLFLLLILLLLFMHLNFIFLNQVTETPEGKDGNQLEFGINRREKSAVE